MMPTKFLNRFFLILLFISTTLFAQGNEVQQQIKALCMDRYRAPGDFVQFTNKLMKLGIIRQTYDVTNDELAFYSKDSMLSHFPAAQLDKSIDKNSFIFGESLDLDILKNAIDKFDHNKLSVVAFHKEVARAGVVYVSVYLKQRKIYYLSQNGQFFLESY
ncbi:DUF1398 family protein [Legionella worsleiensis]|uniref:Phage envelope protein n=1 Tax=Legionella worsleiensis TaxID=45076 RepID=A0A0W1A3I9_9GAMM|nr:DUF1398 family protein [Legionella worsleiensis]KTD75876.1 hypothetical protein Lwor_2442 [Legionella worsleiensis]STY32889.1 Phage envelope protein [Legionella worsleiensis]